MDTATKEIIVTYYSKPCDIYILFIFGHFYDKLVIGSRNIGTIFLQNLLKNIQILIYLFFSKNQDAYIM